jgi:RNA polymerase sigma-70 factor (ECF subfamily)
MPEVADNDPLPVSLARAGDSAAWDALFRRLQLPLYVYVYELVRQEQTSLDIVQETFIAACRHIGTLREDAKFGGWLFGIAHQKCLQHWRKVSGKELLLETIPEEGGEPEHGPDELLIRREREAEFLVLLGQLEPAKSPGSRTPRRAP